MVKQALLQAVGVRQPSVNILPVPVEALRAPSTNDIIAVGQLWLDKSVEPPVIYTHL
jgi:hypothetical protein